MLKKLAAAAVHLLFFAGVVAIGAYWSVRIFTPAPTTAPPPLQPPPLRDPDPTAAARMFGKVAMAQAVVATNIQALGAFAAGEDSSAVLAVDGKPPRVYLVGQEIVPGTRLASITLGSHRARNLDRTPGSATSAAACSGDERSSADAQLCSRRQYLDGPERRGRARHRSAPFGAATASSSPPCPGLRLGRRRLPHHKRSKARLRFAMLTRVLQT